MLTKRQLEDAAKCKSNEACMTCRAWNIEYDGMSDCIEKLAQTALAYRELAEKRRLMKRIESSPKMPIERWTGDEREIICPACKSYICYPEDIKTIDLKYRQFCGACGQKLDWESEVEYDAMCCEDCPCVNYCDGSMIEACMDDWRKRKQIMIC